MHMFLKKHMNGSIRRNGSSQLGFFQRRILPINEVMRPVERIRETVSWTSYRDMIVKSKAAFQMKFGECRKGLVKSSGKSNTFRQKHHKFISRETTESQVPSVQSVGKKQPPLNPAREKPQRRAGNLFRQ